jgi:hypothetical protein
MWVIPRIPRSMQMNQSIFNYTELDKWRDSLDPFCRTMRGIQCTRLTRFPLSLCCLWRFWALITWITISFIPATGVAFMVPEDVSRLIDSWTEILQKTKKNQAKVINWPFSDFCLVFWQNLSLNSRPITDLFQQCKPTFTRDFRILLVCHWRPWLIFYQSWGPPRMTSNLLIKLIVLGSSEGQGIIHYFWSQFATIFWLLTILFSTEI